MTVREYLKLARSFNAVLTGIAPVMGAIAMEQNNLFYLFLLLLVGFLGHTFGFVFNDIVDYRIDKSSTEISDRPLISGTISIGNAWIFAILSMVAAFAVAIFFAYLTNQYFPLIVLVLSAGFITLYDLTSKKFPLTDIFVAIGIFLLILYGAFYGGITVHSFQEITDLAWIVCILGSIQVLFMQTIAGGMKDIENDFRRGANTLAVKMGVRIKDGKLKVSVAFKTLAYSIQLVDLVIVFVPFLIIGMFMEPTLFRYFQWIVLVIIAVLMFFISNRLLSMERFDRRRARRFIGSHYMINFMLAPIMLMTLNPWAGLLVFFPMTGFILSNLIVHGTILQPKTM
jgi:4-hydroxybenzoate polyprenyltransferase